MMIQRWLYGYEKNGDTAQAKIELPKYLWDAAFILAEARDNDDLFGEYPIDVKSARALAKIVGAVASNKLEWQLVSTVVG